MGKPDIFIREWLNTWGSPILHENALKNVK